MARKQKYRVMVAVDVVASDKKQAETEVTDLMSYGFEVSNDAGRFKRYTLDKSQTALVVPRSKQSALAVKEQ